jgi:hypothetical protein
MARLLLGNGETDGQFARVGMVGLLEGFGDVPIEGGRETFQVVEGLLEGGDQFGEGVVGFVGMAGDGKG